MKVKKIEIEFWIVVFKRGYKGSGGKFEYGYFEKVF